MVLPAVIHFQIREMIETFLFHLRKRSHTSVTLLLQNGWFRKSRFRHGKGKASGREGRPRMRERPGLGMRSLSVSVSRTISKTSARTKNKHSKYKLQHGVFNLKEGYVLVPMLVPMLVIIKFGVTLLVTRLL